MKGLTPSWDSLDTAFTVLPFLVGAWLGHYWDPLDLTLGVAACFILGIIIIAILRLLHRWRHPAPKTVAMESLQAVYRWADGSLAGTGTDLPDPMPAHLRAKPIPRAQQASELWHPDLLEFRPRAEVEAWQLRTGYWLETKQQHEEWWAIRTGVTVEDLQRAGQEALPCRCGSVTCPGWRMPGE